MPNIGAHVSTAGGLHTAIERAQGIGAACIQIFGASPRQWSAKVPSKVDVKKFKQAVKESGVGPVYLHAAYLVNLASPNKELVAKSVQNLSIHLRIAELLGAEGLIFHLGSAKGHVRRKAALDQEGRAIKEVLKKAPGKAKLFMENTAGGGEKIGSPEDISYLFKTCNSKRVEVCVDTAHAFEAGMIQEYSRKGVERFAREWDEAVGLEQIPVLQINDSKTACGSFHDRHENIGEGLIGEKGFRELARHAAFKTKDWILEVPGFEGLGPDKKNINILTLLT